MESSVINWAKGFMVGSIKIRLHFFLSGVDVIALGIFTQNAAFIPSGIDIITPRIIWNTQENGGNYYTS